MTDETAAGLIARLREHATDWNGEQMPDAEPAKGDPTAGLMREAAARVAVLEAERDALAARLAAVREAVEAMKRACEQTATRVNRSDGTRAYSLGKWDAARAIFALLDAPTTLADVLDRYDVTDAGVAAMRARFADDFSGEEWADAPATPTGETE